MLQDATSLQHPVLTWQNMASHSNFLSTWRVSHTDTCHTCLTCLLPLFRHEPWVCGARHRRCGTQDIARIRQDIARYPNDPNDPNVHPATVCAETPAGPWRLHHMAPKGLMELTKVIIWPRIKWRNTQIKVKDDKSLNHSRLNDKKLVNLSARTSGSPRMQLEGSQHPFNETPMLCELCPNCETAYAQWLPGNRQPGLSYFKSQTIN